MNEKSEESPFYNPDAQYKELENKEQPMNEEPKKEPVNEYTKRRDAELMRRMEAATRVMLEGRMTIELDQFSFEAFREAVEHAKPVQAPQKPGTSECPLIFEEVVAARMEMLAQDIETASELTASESTREMMPEIALFADKVREVAARKIRESIPKSPAPHPKSVIGIESYYVVNTDNHGSDYPNESLAVTISLTKDAAEKIAELLNVECGADRGGSRYFKVVTNGYVLRPGFVP